VFELPAGDQGASVVVIEDGKGASFRTIPFASADKNATTYELDVELEADGNAVVEHRMSLVGSSAAGWRASLEAKEERQELLTQRLSRTFPGTEVRRAEFPGIEDVLAPVVVEAELAVPGWAVAQQGNSLRWRVLGHDVELLRGVAPQARREHPLMLGVPNRETRIIRYSLPRGFDLRQLPEARRVDSPFGRFDLTIEPTPRGANVTTTLEFSRPRVEPSEYEAFREFLREVDTALAQAFEAAPSR
jgi:hypothetical protein